MTAAAPEIQPISILDFNLKVMGLLRMRANMKKQTHSLRQLQPIRRRAGIAVLIVLLIASSINHATTRASMSPELLAYVAHGGSLSDICDDYDVGDQSFSHGCDACRMAGPAVLPFVNVVTSDAFSPVSQAVLFVAILLQRHEPLDLGRLSRAPPVVWYAQLR